MKKKMAAKGKIQAEMGRLPLCDKCLVPMWGIESRQVYECRERGCSRRYNGKLGYFDYADGSMTVEDQQRHCAKDNSPLFIDSISPEAIETWRCLHCDFELKNQRHLPFEGSTTVN